MHMNLVNLQRHTSDYENCNYYKNYLLARFTKFKNQLWPIFQYQFFIFGCSSAFFLFKI